MTPGSRWRERYRGWRAMAKLKYVDRIARQVGEADPIRQRGRTDITVEEMEATVAEFYQRSGDEGAVIADLPLNTDLVDLFNASKRRRKGVRPASDLIREHRKALIDKVTYWTGVPRPLIKRLIESIQGKVAELDLRVEIARETDQLTELTAYTTTLAMNYLTRGKFVQP
jgi:hypothetical protein